LGSQSVVQASFENQTACGFSQLPRKGIVCPVSPNGVRE
jgi:hypothetical protein